MLKAAVTGNLIEAGCDEAGRGCLAGPVYAAAVILPKDYHDSLLNDSKMLTVRQREKLRLIIEKEAIDYAVACVDNQTIDQINILNASILAMHRAIDHLKVRPELILADGNRFHPYPGIPHHCIIRGDATLLSIAAASVLAKTYRDDFMVDINREYPMYGWIKNKGYPTPHHRRAIMKFGLSPFHRLTFKCTDTPDLFSAGIVY